jgi:hypothetical protein
MRRGQNWSEVIKLRLATRWKEAYHSNGADEEDTGQIGMFVKTRKI